jgi:hypothetical protein
VHKGEASVFASQYDENLYQSLTVQHPHYQNAQRTLHRSMVIRLDLGQKPVAARLVDDTHLLQIQGVLPLTDFGASTVSCGPLSGAAFASFVWRFEWRRW